MATPSPICAITLARRAANSSGGKMSVKTGWANGLAPSVTSNASKSCECLCITPIEDQKIPGNRSAICPDCATVSRLSTSIQVAIGDFAKACRRNESPVRRLPIQADAELHRAGSAAPSDLPERSRGRAGSCDVEERVVQEVQRHQPESHPHPLGEADLLV